ncbi:MAG: hypothetical protein PHU43_00125 [Candidatus Bipolaricaulis sp.]|nr:hypothetical protein [Candidatus Bipolaricaulis sp.]
MALYETVGVTVSAKGWERSGSMSRDEIKFDTDVSGLVLVLTVENSPHKDDLCSGLRALDLGSIINIELADGIEQPSSVFKSAILVSKRATYVRGEVSAKLLSAVAKQDGYPGPIELAFHVGPITEG